MISQTKQKGFTIVELLIVIVVIGILAAISLVAYTNITARAKSSTAASTAKAVKDAATAYNGANGSYPTAKTQLVSGGADPIAKLPADITFMTSTMANAGTTVQGSDDAKSVVVIPCTTLGLRIFYRDFIGSTAKSVDVGNCSTAPVSTVNSIT